MKLPSLMLFIAVSCLLLAAPTVLRAQVRVGAGLITAVDLDMNTLVLETRNGPRQIRLAAAAAIRGDHGQTLSIRDLRPGDAVSYQTADVATSVWVASQFWAIPREW